jgi:hypothetical protein
MAAEQSQVSSKPMQRSFMEETIPASAPRYNHRHKTASSCDARNIVLTQFKVTMLLKNTRIRTV